MSVLSDSAKAYAQTEGLYVFPLKEHGKTPLTAHGLEDATTDALTIETWWGRWPDANIAIRTGDLVVVDEDYPGALLELAERQHQQLPQTRIARTGKGRHYYFTQPQGQRIRNTAGKLAPGVDTRGDGGYVVAPPSIHPSGAVYTWEAECDPAPFPAWLAEQLATPQPERTPLPELAAAPGTTPYGQRALEQELASVALAAEGTRNHTLNTAAFALGQLVAGGEIDEYDAQRSLEAAAQACGLPEREAKLTIESGFTSGQAKPRRAPESNKPGNNGSPLKLVSNTVDALTETEPERDSWIPLNLNDLPETPPVQPDLGATHLVYPGKRHVFSGPPESAKTLAAYCILIQIARQGGMGILIDFEMGGYDARKRLTELGATSAEIDRILYIEPDHPATPERITRLVELGPQLIVIDASAGVYSLEGLDDNKRLDVEKVSALYIKAFWRNQIATILIDHVVKDTETRGRYAIGSERKLGGADVHLGFDTIQPISRGTNGKYKITTHKDRGGFLKRGHLADLTLASHPDTHDIAWAVSEPPLITDEQGELRPSIKMEQISNKLSGRTERLTVNEVKDLVGGNRKMAGTAINLMLEEGYLDAEDGPRSAKLLLLKRPYTAKTDPRMQGDSEGPGTPVPVWFSSGSGTGDQVTGSLVPGVHTPEPVQNRCHPTTDPPQKTDQFPGWLNKEGQLEPPQRHNVDSLTDDIPF